MGFRQQEAFSQIGVAAQRRNLVRQEVGIVTEILIVKEILNVEVIIAENSASTGERLQIAVMVYIIKFNIHILRMWSIYFKGNFIKKLSQSLFFTFKVAKSCNGKPKIKWSCCTTGSPCDVGGGDCDKDSHCSGNLVCGNNNCRKWGKHWKRSADCCEGMKFHYRRRKYRTHIDILSNHMYS